MPNAWANESSNAGRLNPGTLPRNTALLGPGAKLRDSLCGSGHLALLLSDEDGGVQIETSQPSTSLRVRVDEAK